MIAASAFAALCWTKNRYERWMCWSLVLWFVYDAATKIWRCGLNNTAIAAQQTMTVTRNGAGDGTIIYPFGYSNNGSCGTWKFHRWCLLNKAYMNGAVVADDNQFTALIAAHAAMI